MQPEGIEYSDTVHRTQGEAKPTHLTARRFGSAWIVSARLGSARTAQRGSARHDAGRLGTARPGSHRAQKAARFAPLASLREAQHTARWHWTRLGSARLSAHGSARRSTARLGNTLAHARHTEAVSMGAGDWVRRGSSVESAPSMNSRRKCPMQNSRRPATRHGALAGGCARVVAADDEREAAARKRSGNENDENA